MSKKIEHIEKSELLEEIHESRNRLESTVQSISPTQMLYTDVQDGWSVKDILAHIVSWEKRMIQWMSTTIAGDIPQEFIPELNWDVIHRLNEETYILNKDRSLEEILVDFHRSYGKTIEFLKNTSAKDLEDPNRFPWRNGSPLWRMAASNTWWHYDEHCETIQNWLQHQNTIK